MEKASFRRCGMLSRSTRRTALQLCLVGMLLCLVLVEVVDAKAKFKKKRKRDPSKVQRYFWWAVSVLLGIPCCIFFWSVVRDPALPRLFKLAWSKCRGKLSKSLAADQRKTTDVASAGSRTNARGGLARNNAGKTD